jgi:hypothetical protein
MALPMPIPVPVYGPMNYHDHLDNIDKVLSYIADPNIYSIETAIHMSYQFSLPAIFMAFHKRAKKVILTKNGLEEVIRIKEFLIRMSIDALKQNSDVMNVVFLKMPRNNDVWDVCSTSLNTFAAYINAVKVLSSVDLPIDICRYILDIAFNM